MDESIDGEQTLDGTYVNLYDTALSVVKNPTLICGTVGLWYDLSRIDKSGCSDILALSGRAEKLTRTRRMLSFVFRGPADMTAAARIWTKRPPQVITADGNEIPFVCDAETGTTYFDFPSNGEPIQIKVKF